jgi:hypothetical protein
MSRFKLIEIEKEETESYPCYADLDLNRETEYRIYEFWEDQYGNKNNRIIITTPNLFYAKKFLRSCQLIDGIEINDFD